jgi:DNA polymerase-3 subunit delta
MTKVAAGDLPRFLGGGFRSYAAALVFGGDEGMVRETVDRLVAAAAGPDPDPLNLIALDGDALAADPPRLADEMRAFSMFGGKRVISVRGAGKVAASLIENALAEPSADTFLVLEAGDLKSTTGSLRGFAERAKTVAAIACYSDTTRSISTLIDETLAAHDLTIAREARQALIGALGADRGLSRSELEKLALYAHDERSVSIDMVTDIIADAGRHDTSTLLDHTFAGNLPFIEGEANRLFAAGTHPSAVLTQAIGHVMLLRKIARSSLDEVARSARIHFSRMALLERAQQRWTETRLAQIFPLLAEAMRQTRASARLADVITIRALWSIARMARQESA